MSAKNSLKNKQKRRAEREAHKAYMDRIRAFAVTRSEVEEVVEETPRVSDLVIAETSLWTPGS